jgi:hypothetical protein
MATHHLGRKCTMAQKNALEAPQPQHDESDEHFAKQLLDIGNGKIAIDESTKCITSPTNFCNITSTRDELIQKVFPNIVQHWLISGSVNVLY